MTDLDELKALWSDAPQVLALIERLEKAEGDKEILNGALSMVCDERDAAYDEVDELTKKSNELFDDIEKITSANADLAGWSRAKDERISELEKRLAEYEDTPRGTS